MLRVTHRGRADEGWGLRLERVTNTSAAHRLIARRCSLVSRRDWLAGHARDPGCQASVVLGERMLACVGREEYSQFARVAH